MKVLIDQKLNDKYDPSFKELSQGMRNGCSQVGIQAYKNDNDTHCKMLRF